MIHKRRKMDVTRERIRRISELRASGNSGVGLLTNQHAVFETTSLNDSVLELTCCGCLCALTKHHFLERDRFKLLSRPRLENSPYCCYTTEPSLQKIVSITLHFLFAGVGGWVGGGGGSERLYSLSHTHTRLPATCR